MSRVPRVSVQSMVVLAAAVGEDGITAAGITPQGEWLRPVRRATTLKLPDISYPNKTVMHGFDIVQLPIIRHHPNPPYVENAITDFDYAGPRLAGQIAPSQRADWLAAHAEPVAEAVQAVYKRQERSLALVEVQELYATVRRDSVGGLVTKVWAEELQQPRPIHCNGVHWRAFCRTILGTESARNYTWPELRDLLGCQRIYLVISLTSPMPGEFWPVVLGIKTVPGYDATIDYRNL